MPAHNRTQHDRELSIIILSYNTASLTKQTIESVIQSLKQSKISYELIVRDNASTDESPQMLKQLESTFPQMDVLYGTENLGFSKGNNAAAKHASGQYLLFLNSDIIVHDTAIAELLSFQQQQGEKAFCGGKLFNTDGTAQPSCGPFYTLPVVFGALFLRGDYWGLTRYSPDHDKQVDWVSGACLMTSRHAFEELSGFDEEIFMYMEEIDLLYRAAQKDYKTFFSHKARFTHLGSASSTGKTYPILQVYKGFLYFYKKHYASPAVTLLKGMLQLKAQIAIWVGKITKNPYLIDTYGTAQKLVEVA